MQTEDNKFQLTNMYSFNQKALLTFNDFYKSIQSEPSMSEPVLLNLQTSTEFVFVQIKDDIIFSLGEKTDDKYKIKRNLLKNQLGGSFFKKIYNVHHNSNQHSELNKLSKKCFQIDIKNCPDLLVGDIYGPDSSIIGLPQNMLAASLGKLTKQSIQNFNKLQIIRSLIMSIGINAAQVCGLLTQKYKLTNVILLSNDFDSLGFNRLFYTLMAFYAPNTKVYFRQNLQ